MGELMDWHNTQFGQLGYGLSGGTAAGLGNYGLQQQAAMQNQQWYPTTYTAGTTSNAMSLADYNRLVDDAAKKVKKAVQKTGKILLDLRKEIDDWHGDILMRAA